MKGSEIMFDAYERVNLYSKKNSKMSICDAYDEGISLIKRYSAFLILKQREFSFNREAKEDFLKELIEEKNTDVLANILEQDFEAAQKKQLIEFWYTPESLADEINQFKLEAADDFEEKEKQQLRELENEDRMNQLTNLKFDNSVRFMKNISFTEPNRIEVLIFTNLGCFVSVGCDVDLNQNNIHTFDEYLTIFKALGDASRFQMFNILLQEPQNATQLSEKLNLTLPTITHHIKTLSQSGIVSPVISTLSHKGTMYQVNKELIREILKEIENGLS